MKVLVFCEESQTVCKAFRQRGHEAFSADIKPCSGGHPEWHIQGDGSFLLNGRCVFYTSDGVLHTIVEDSKWDLLICHPPCTYLSKAGACVLFDFYGKIKNQQRYEKGLAARQFFYMCLNADCPRICVENPVPIGIFSLPAYQQIIEPYYFGDPYTKKTLLWLKGLPELIFSHSLSDYDSVSSWCAIHLSASLRSKTFQGVADAMASQWTEDAKPLQISIFDF